MNARASAAFTAGLVALLAFLAFACEDGNAETPSSMAGMRGQPTLLFTVGKSLSRWSPGAGRAKKLLIAGDEDGAAFSPPMWSPIGDALLLNSTSAIMTVPIVEGAPATIAEVSSEQVQRFEWLAGGHRVLYEIDGDVFVASRTGSVPVELRALAPHIEGSVLASPDGAWVAAVVYEVVVEEGMDAADAGETCSHIVVSRADGSDSFELPDGTKPDDCLNASQAQWSPDGRYLAYVLGRWSRPSSRIFVVDTESRTQVEVLAPSAKQIGDLDLRWRANGHELITARQQSGMLDIGIFDVVLSKQTTSVALPDESREYYFIAFEIGDAILVCTGQGTQLLKRDDKTHVLSSEFFDRNCGGFEISSDGEHVAIPSGELSSQSLRIVSLDDDSVSVLEGAKLASANMGAWSPDGKTLAYVQQSADAVDLKLFSPATADAEAQRTLGKVSSNELGFTSAEWVDDDVLLTGSRLTDKKPPTLRVFDVDTGEVTDAKAQRFAGNTSRRSSAQAFCTIEVKGGTISYEPGDSDDDEGGGHYYYEEGVGTQRLLLWWRSKASDEWKTQVLDERPYDGTGECFIP